METADMDYVAHKFDDSVLHPQIYFLSVLKCILILQNLQIVWLYTYLIIQVLFYFSYLRLFLPNAVQTMTGNSWRHPWKTSWQVAFKF